MSDRCDRCGERPLFGMDRHRCDPLWDVWGEDIMRPNREDSVMDVRAHDAEEAAEKGVEKDEWESSEWPVAGKGQVVRVFVAQEGKDEIHQFTVSGESVPQYSAIELSKDEVAIIHDMEEKGYKYDSHWGEFRKGKERIRLRELVKQRKTA